MNKRTIRLSRTDYNLMLQGATQVLPEEACGLLAGLLIDGTYEIRKVYVLENTDHSPEHFSMNLKEQLSVVKDIRNNGLIPLGNWHSHPATPSRPSEEDKRLAYDRNAIYMILSLAEKEPVLNAFHIDKATSRKENLIITD